MDFLTNPIIISILGSLIAVMLIYIDSQMSNKQSVHDNKDYIKYFAIISLIIYGATYLLNKRNIQSGGTASRDIFVGNPDF